MKNKNTFGNYFLFLFKKNIEMLLLIIFIYQKHNIFNFPKKA